MVLSVVEMMFMMRCCNDGNGHYLGHGLLSLRVVLRRESSSRFFLAEIKQITVAYLHPDLRFNVFVGQLASVESILTFD